MKRRPSSSSSFFFFFAPLFAQADSAKAKTGSSSFLSSPLPKSEEEREKTFHIIRIFEQQRFPFFFSAVESPNQIAHSPLSTFLWGGGPYRETTKINRPFAPADNGTLFAPSPNDGFSKKKKKDEMGDIFFLFSRSGKRTACDGRFRSRGRTDKWTACSAAATGSAQKPILLPSPK